MTTVSVVIGVLNNFSGLEKTLISITRQSLKEGLEVIVIDDGSTLESAQKISEICNKYLHVRLLKNRINQGLTHSLIRGCNMANGQYIARIDAGDVFIDTNHLLYCINFLNNNVDVAIVGANIIVNNNYLGKKFLMKNPSIVTKVDVNGVRETLFVHVTVVFRKDVYHRVGGYDSEYYRGQDTELWKRMLAEGEGYFLPHIATLVEMHKDSISIKHNNEQYIAVLRDKVFRHFLRGDITAMGDILMTAIKLLLPTRIRISMMYRRSYRILSKTQYERITTPS